MSAAGRRSLVSRLRSSVRAFLLSDEPPEWFWKSHGVSRPTLSGVAVTDQTALRVTAVLSCVKVLAESISTLPLMVFERQANGDKRPAAEHPLSSILHTLCNEEATAQSVRESLSAHVLLRGNAYARVVRDGGGDGARTCTGSSAPYGQCQTSRNAHVSASSLARWHSPHSTATTSRPRRTLTTSMRTNP